MAKEKNVVVQEDGYCFACGANNPVGLHLDFREIDGKFIAHKTLEREYQSFAGIVHGGIVTTLLDEAMGGFLCRRGEPAVTARLDVRYRQPTPVGAELTITGWIESERHNIINMKATVAMPDGTITAEGTAKMALVGHE